LPNQRCRGAKGREPFGGPDDGLAETVRRVLLVDLEAVLAWQRELSQTRCDAGKACA